MSMEYIRNTYGVPAKRGGGVMVMLDGFSIKGTITGSKGAYLRILLPGRRRSGLYHPTWALQYLTPNVELTGSRAALLPVSPESEANEVERRVGGAE